MTAVPEELARTHARWMARGLGAAATVTVAGLAGMVLAALLTGGTLRTIVAGGSGAVCSALLVDLGLVATSLIAVRAGPLDEPVLGIEAHALRDASVALAGLGLAFGALVMGVSFARILASDALEGLAVGSFGFVAGTLVVSGSGLAGLWSLLHPVARPGSGVALPESPLEAESDDQ